MPPIVEIIGDTVIDNTGKRIAASDLLSDGKIIGLYFSASWCPPCIGFGPKLVEFYNKFRDKLSVVFISSDKDEDCFMEYFKEMPWYAMPFQERDRKTKLTKKFQVQAIPTLVFVEGRTGKLITTDGRNNILDDPEGAHFPWYPKSLSDILSGPLKCGDGHVDTEHALQGKVKAFYFSAHWCPPCRGFTPTLMKVYEKLRGEGRNFEVVFVSSDRSDESYNIYVNTMPWLAIPYGDPRCSQLTKHFGVQGIPTLIILDEKNEIITTNGRALLTKDPEGKDFPWPSKALNELDDVTAQCLNESACLIYFTDGEDEHMKFAQEAMTDAANKYVQEQSASKNTDKELPELKFLYEGFEAEEIADSLRNLADLDEDKTPLLAVFDIPEQQVYAHPATATGEPTPITSDTIQEIVNQFKRNTLPFVPLKR